MAKNIKYVSKRNLNIVGAILSLTCSLQLKAETPTPTKGFVPVEAIDSVKYAKDGELNFIIQMPQLLNIVDISTDNKSINEKGQVNFTYCNREIEAGRTCSLNVENNEYITKLEFSHQNNKITLKVNLDQQKAPLSTVPIKIEYTNKNQSSSMQTIPVFLFLLTDQGSEVCSIATPYTYLDLGTIAQSDIKAAGERNKKIHGHFKIKANCSKASLAPTLTLENSNTQYNNIYVSDESPTAKGYAVQLISGDRAVDLTQKLSPTMQGQGTNDLNPEWEYDVSLVKNPDAQLQIPGQFKTTMVFTLDYGASTN